MRIPAERAGLDEAQNNSALKELRFRDNNVVKF
jgi:hypothetical protein